MLVDLSSLRLQYEILNRSLESLASELNIPLLAIEQEASNNKWVQWFPGGDLVVDPASNLSVEDMEEECEEFVTKSKQRLAIYNIAKELLLAQKYLALEVKIIDEANNILDSSELDAKTIKALSSLYVDMTKTSVSNALASMSFGMDDSGLPTVIVKDLSGRKS